VYSLCDAAAAGAMEFILLSILPLARNKQLDYYFQIGMREARKKRHSQRK
jgi:hypothetical protein